MFLFRPWIVAVFAVLLCACAPHPVRVLDHEAYIWQRQWTPALSASLTSMGSDFTGWHVLAAESTAGGGLIDAAPQLDLLARSGKPVTAVFRLNGSRPPPSVDALAQRIGGIAAAWHAAGVSLVGIEIDHDCSTARLDAYAEMLAQLRPRLPDGLRLSITALPTWIGAPALPRALAAVDASVLQVHAIAAPRAGSNATGLFDAAQALRWIDIYAAIAPQPFRIALPSYGMRVGFDEDGRAVAVEGEMQRTIDADSSRELRVDPRDVAALLRRLEQSTHPARLAGIVWFRLPTEDDRRAWSGSTLHAVIAGSTLQADFVARTERGDDGAADLILANRGSLDAPLPASVDITAANCAAADAVSGYRAEKSSRGWRFFPGTDAILRAQHEQNIGWLRCASIEGVAVHENP